MRPPGPTTSRGPRSCATSPTAAARARSGRPRRPPTGRRWSRTPSPRPWRPAAVRWSASPTARTSPGSTRALTDVLGPGQHVTLTADSGPARRYRDFLAVSRGARRVVVGTRAASFAPVHDLGLVVIWDDGDDLHAEPRAPYPHTRETLLLRAEREGAAALVGGFVRTVEGEYLLRTGWARELDPDPRGAAPGHRGDRRRAGVRDVQARGARIPREVHTADPRRGRARPGAGADPAARLRHRAGLRALPHAGPLRRLPGAAGADRADHAAGLPLVRRRRRGVGLRRVRPPRAARAGPRRRAHRRGARPRASRASPVRTSSGDQVLATVARPAPDRGRDAGRRAGGRGRVRRRRAARHLAAAVADRPARRGGGAAPLGERRRPGPPRRPGGRGRRSRAPGAAGAGALGPGRLRRPRDRRSGSEAHLPPASRLATITGEPGAVDDALTLLAAPPSAEVLGPVDIGEGECRVVVRVPRAHGADLSRALGELQRVRSSRKLDAVRIQVDPLDPLTVAP